MRTHSLITLTLAVGLLLGVGPAASAHTSPVTARKIIAQAQAAQKSWPCARGRVQTARTLAAAATAAQEASSGWALVAVGEQAAARAAQEAPSELVHDVKSVLRDAGFRPERAERGIPGRAPFIARIERIAYSRPALRDPQLGGFDAIGNYLRTTLDTWDAARVGDRWTWIIDSDESMTLTYHAAGHGRPSARRAWAELVVVHYTPLR